MRIKPQLAITAALALAIGFVGGLRTASAGKGADPFQLTLNGGLVHASNSVLQNLLGTAVVAVREDGAGGVAIDLADDTMIPVSVNFFRRDAPTGSGFPPDPCRTFLHVGVGGGTSVQIDSTSNPDGSDPQPLPPGGFPPDPCRALVTELPG